MTPEQEAGANKVTDFLHIEADDYHARQYRERMEEILINVRGQALQCLTRMSPRRTDGATYTVEDFIRDADKITQWAVTGTVPERPEVNPNPETRLS